MVNYSRFIGRAARLMQMPSMIESPSDRVPEKAPRCDLTGTEACDGGKVFWWTLLMFGEYVRIYRSDFRVGGLPRGPQALRVRPSQGALSRLVASSGTFWPPLQVLRVSSGPRKSSRKFYSVWSVWYSFSVKLKNKEKTETSSGIYVNSLAPKINTPSVPKYRVYCFWHGN